MTTISKIFRNIATILIRFAGIIFAIVALGMLWQSIGICANLADCLSPAAQFDISIWRLIFLFILNAIALIFDWCIAIVIIVISIGMVLYKTEVLEEIAEMEI